MTPIKSETNSFSHSFIFVHFLSHATHPSTHTCTKLVKCLQKQAGGRRAATVLHANRLNEQLYCIYEHDSVCVRMAFSWAYHCLFQTPPKKLQFNCYSNLKSCLPGGKEQLSRMEQLFLKRTLKWFSNLFRPCFNGFPFPTHVADDCQMCDDFKDMEPDADALGSLHNWAPVFTDKFMGIQADFHPVIEQGKERG